MSRTFRTTPVRDSSRQLRSCRCEALRRRISPWHGAPARTRSWSGRWSASRSRSGMPRRLTTPAGERRAKRCSSCRRGGRRVAAMSTITADALEPYVSQQDDPWWYGDSLFEFLIPSHATGGQIAVFRSTMPQGFSPPRHIHTREDEVFLVEAGDACFEIAG